MLDEYFSNSEDHEYWGACLWQSQTMFGYTKSTSGKYPCRVLFKAGATFLTVKHQTISKKRIFYAPSDP